MRFTWVALPILLTAIGPAAPAASALTPLDDEETRRAPSLGAAQERHLAVSTLFAGVGTPRPSEARGRRLEGEIAADEESEETSPVAGAEPRLRQVGIAWLEFHTHLAHALSGFLPSYSTACPPPVFA